VFEAAAALINADAKDLKQNLTNITRAEKPAKDPVDTAEAVAK
jgi:hypothetical protein